MSAPPARPASISPWWVRGLVAAGVIAFLVTVLSHAAQAAVLNPGYYQGVLRNEKAYERAYGELSRDPALVSASRDLLGVPEIPLLDQIPGMLVQAIPLRLVENMVDRAIEDLIAYLKKHKKLQLTLDITPFVGGAGSPGLQQAIDALGGLTGGEGPDLEEFQKNLDDILDRIGGRGQRIDAPSGTPEARLPAEASAELALRRGGDRAPELLLAGAGGIADLRTAKFVREETVNGETRYLLGPPQRIVDKIDSALFIVQLISANSYWLRPVGLAVFVVAMAALVYVSRRERGSLARRVGVVLLAGGLIGLIGWLVALPLFQGMVIDAAFEGGRAPSAAFDDLARDVLRRCVSNISPYIWLPAGIAAGMGGALVVLAQTVLRPRPRRA